MVKSMTMFLDGERVEPHETLSLEKVSDIIKELGRGTTKSTLLVLVFLPAKLVKLIDTLNGYFFALLLLTFGVSKPATYGGMNY